jgi:hypothetical protein
VTSNEWRVARSSLIAELAGCWLIFRIEPELLTQTWGSFRANRARQRSQPNRAGGCFGDFCDRPWIRSRVAGAAAHKQNTIRQHYSVTFKNSGQKTCCSANGSTARQNVAPREPARRCSAWVPVTHASVTPFRDVFQTCAVAPLAGFAAAARFLARTSAARVTK